MLETLRLETIILRALRTNEGFSRRCLPFLKESYFSERSERLVFEQIKQFIVTYNSLPTHEALVILMTNLDNIKEDELKGALETLAVIEKTKGERVDDQWLLDQTEKFCQDKAIYGAVLESITILDDKSGKLSKGAIPQLLSDALAVSFDTSIGHDYLEDADKRFEDYHRQDKKYPCDIELLNRIMNGGAQEKTLNLVTAGINVGKTLMLCHLSAAYMSQGFDVLYVTGEMSQEEIAKRIDANLLNIDINELDKIPKLMYDKKVEKLKERTTGRLIIKEYPTAGFSVSNIRALLHELKLKRNFRPKILIVDYINLMCSARLKADARGESYHYVKSIAEELRGLCVEFELVGWTATQLTRSGFDSSDPGMTHTAESFALPATVDFQIVVVVTEELEKLGQAMVKQLKNRYNRKSVNKKFIIGIDGLKMRLYDVEQSAQEDLDGAGQETPQTETPVMDQTAVGQKYSGFTF